MLDVHRPSLLEPKWRRRRKKKKERNATKKKKKKKKRMSPIYIHICAVYFGDVSIWAFFSVSPRHLHACKTHAGMYDIALQRQA